MQGIGGILDRMHAGPGLALHRTLLATQAFGKPRPALVDD